jgi:hypothetical protein
MLIINLFKQKGCNVWLHPPKFFAKLMQPAERLPNEFEHSNSKITP